jgi:hypothetical protein
MDFTPVTVAEILAPPAPTIERSPRHLPVCQLPTSRGKLLVCLDAARGRVIKGPYAPSRIATLAEHLTTARLLRAFGDTTVPEMHEAVDGELFERWVVMAHIHPPSIKGGAAAVAIETKTHGRLMVLPREHQGVTQASKVEAPERTLAPVSWEIIRSLWLRYLFWIADTHLGNELVSDRRDDGRYYVCASVDASEHRGARQTPLAVDSPTWEFLMAKRPLPAVRELVRVWTIAHHAELLSTFVAWDVRLAQLPGPRDAERDARLALATLHVQSLQ